MKNQNKSKPDSHPEGEKRPTRFSPPKRSAETRRTGNDSTPAQTEESLRAGEPQLRMMFDSMTEGVALNEIVYDDKGEMIDYRILNVNRAYYSIADYTGTQVIGNVATRLYGMTREFIQSFWKEHRQKNTTTFTEMWSPLNNKCYFIAISPFVEDKFITSFMDITERKQMEAALRESEEKWRSLVMTIPDFVAIHDGNGKYLFLNHFADGFTEKDVIGRSIYDFISPEARPLFKLSIEELQKTGRMQQFEFLGLGARGEPRIYEETLVSLKSSKGETNMLAFARDITDHKQVEDRLQESEERYRDLVENSQELIYTHDLNGKLLSVNHTAALMLGYNPTNLVGRYLGELLAPEDRSQFKDYIDRIRRKVSDTGTWVLQSATGDRRTWEYHSMIRPDAKQGPYVRGMAHDITERMNVESALRESEERFQKIFDEGPIGMVLTSHYLQFFSANPAFCRMLGYTVEEMNSKTFLEVTHPEHREQDRQSMEKLWQGEIPEYRTQKRYIAKNGSIRWGSLSTSILHGQDGEPQYALTIAEDITKRKYAEEATLRRNAELAALNQIGQALSKLAKPEEMLELIFKVIGQVMDNRNLFIALYDQASQTITFPVYAINGERIFGGDRPLGNGITDYIIRTNTPLLVKQNLAEALAQRGIDLIGSPSRSFIAVPMCLGDKVIGVIALQDYDHENAYDEQQLELLTTMAAQASTALENARLFDQVQQELEERKQAEEARQASEERYRSLFENMQEGMAYCHMLFHAGQPQDFVYLEVNSSFERLTGLKNVVGKRVSEVIPGIRTSDPALFEMYGRVALTGKPEKCEIYVVALKMWFAISAYSPRREYFVALFDVITERKHKEEILQDSEAALNQAQRVAHVGSWRWHIQSNTLEWSDEMYRLFGIEKKNFSGNLGEVIAKAIHPEDRALVDESNRSVSEAGIAVPLEYRVVWPDGSIHSVWGEAGELVKDEKGQTVLLSGIVQDITERKRVEEALRESETRSRAVFDGVDDAIFVETLEGRILDANRRACEMYGYSHADLLTKKVADLVPSEDYIVAFHPNKSPTLPIHPFETINVRASGEQFPIELNFSTQTINGEQVLFVVGRDISERKRAEHSLRQSEARYRAILEQAAVGISQADSATGAYIDVNQKFCDIVGYSRDEILATTFQDITHPDDLGADLDHMQDLRAGNIRTFSMEKRYYRKDKSIIWVNLTVSPLWAVGEEPSSHVAVVEDITKRKQAEMELAQSHEHLRALGQYLQAAREEERTFIAREIHDELGQELTALKMDLAWLSRQLPPEQVQLVQKTAAISNMVDGTIQTVRRVASQLRPGLLDDLGLVAALEWQAGEFQTRTGIACSLDLPENVSTLSRDQATAIFRVFQETLTNIARHAQATRVRITLKDFSDSIELTVRDNGIGITQDQLTDPRSLGLTGMRERVQAFGGTLEFKSATGKGTTVRVIMPLLNMSLDKEA